MFPKNVNLNDAAVLTTWFKNKMVVVSHVVVIVDVLHQQVALFHMAIQELRPMMLRLMIPRQMMTRQEEGREMY